MCFQPGWILQGSPDPQVSLCVPEDALRGGFHYEFQNPAPDSTILLSLLKGCSVRLSGQLSCPLSAISSVLLCCMGVAMLINSAQRCSQLAWVQPHVAHLHWWEWGMARALRVLLLPSTRSLQHINCSQCWKSSCGLYQQRQEGGLQGQASARVVAL